MKRRELTREEIEKRFEEINAMEPEVMTPEEAASLAEAEAMDDGTTMTLEKFKKLHERCSGKLVLRIPRSLHRELKEQAALEGVSLNQYMLYKLAR